MKRSQTITALKPAYPTAARARYKTSLERETVKSDGPSFRNEDESRCKSSRERKTRRDGVIIDLANDVYGTCRSDIKISVISILHWPKWTLSQYQIADFPSNATSESKYIEIL